MKPSFALAIRINIDMVQNVEGSNPWQKIPSLAQVGHHTKKCLKNFDRLWFVIGWQTAIKRSGLKREIVI